MLTFEDIEKLIDIVYTQQTLANQTYASLETAVKEAESNKSLYSEEQMKIFAFYKDSLLSKASELKGYARLINKLYDLQERLMDTKGDLTYNDIIGQ